MSESRGYLYRYISYLSRDAGLDSTDKHYLAETVVPEAAERLGGIDSLRDLTVPELKRVLDALKGWQAVQSLRYANGHLAIEAEVVLEKLKETAQETQQRQDRDDSWN